MASFVIARLLIKVIPRASKNEISGWVGDSLKIRIVAPPERGKANEAVIGTIAIALKLPRSSVRIVTGFAATRKTVEVEGITEAELRLRIEDFLLRNLRKNTG